MSPHCRILLLYTLLNTWCLFKKKKKKREEEEGHKGSLVMLIKIIWQTKSAESDISQLSQVLLI